MKLCEYVSPADPNKMRRCPAEAVDGLYCPAHRALVRGQIARRSTEKPDPDRDLLPFSEQEFNSLAELRERSR